MLVIFSCMLKGKTQREAALKEEAELDILHYRQPINLDKMTPEFYGEYYSRTRHMTEQTKTRFQNALRRT